MEHQEPERGLSGRGAAKTAIQLVVASIFVGAILALFDLSPIKFWQGLFDSVKDLLAMIGESFGEIVVNLVTYLVLGAAIVVPIWLISRMISGRRK